MQERDIEKNVTTEQFIATLRRCADALEKGESFRIQIASERFTIPAGAELSIEHEREADGDEFEEEVEFQLKWKSGH